MVIFSCSVATLRRGRRERAPHRARQLAAGGEIAGLGAQRAEVAPAQHRQRPRGARLRLAGAAAARDERLLGPAHVAEHFGPAEDREAFRPRMRDGLPARLLVEERAQRGPGPQLHVVDQQRAAGAQAQRGELEVHERDGEGVRAVDQDEVQRLGLQPRQRVLRACGMEAQAARVDIVLGAPRTDAVDLVLHRHDAVVHGAQHGERARAHARTGLQRAAAGPDRVADDLQRLGRDAEGLARAVVAVQWRRVAQQPGEQGVTVHPRHRSARLRGR